MRETKTLKTPLGLELVINAWLTGEEEEDVASCYLKNIQFSVTEDGKPRPEKVDVAAGQRDEARRLLETLVVSYGGSADSAVKRLREAPACELKFAMNECEAVRKDPSMPKNA